jgi:predicted  nucleic acid-binding Zn-ribbon protein
MHLARAQLLQPKDSCSNSQSELQRTQLKHAAAQQECQSLLQELQQVSGKLTDTEQQKQAAEAGQQASEVDVTELKQKLEDSLRSLKQQTQACEQYSNQLTNKADRAARGEEQL